MNPIRLSTNIAAIIAGIILNVACGSTKTVTVQPATANLVLMRGATNTTESAVCDPPSPPRPDPVGRWNAEPPENKTLLAVGFEVWRNTTDSCTENKGVMYRGVIQYDLTSVVALKGTTTKAALSFSTKVLPAGATANASNLCDAHDGGLGSLFAVNPPPIQLFSNMVDLTAPNASFPAGTRLVAFPIPWVGGTIGSNATSTSSGPGSAGFTVDVTGSVLNALAVNMTTIQFMLSGSDEAFPRSTPPPSSFDCRTLFQVDPLEITVAVN